MDGGIKVKHAFYNNPEIWFGGYYELSLEYHPVGNDERLNKAMNALCTCGFINGLWREKKDFYKKTMTLPVTIEDSAFYGTISVSEQSELPCMISIIRVNGESDWIDIGIPLASFEKKYPFRYPLTKELNPWLQTINERYTELGEIIFGDSPFDFAMIGEEISGYTNQEELSVEIMDEITCLFPEGLQTRLGIQDMGRKLSNGLRIVEN